MKLPVPGICDRCGQRYLLKELKEIVIVSSRTGVLVCRSCWEPSQPQLDTRTVKTNDKQYVKNSRSDKNELAQSRELFAWNPVGHESTNVADFKVGNVRVVIT